MENTFALWGFVTAGSLAVVLIYASIADRWYKLKARIAELEDEKREMQRWMDKQRSELVKKQNDVAQLMSDLRTQAAKQPAKKEAEVKLGKKQDRSKGFIANNDIKVWHKCVPSTALARVQARINKGDEWANIYASNSGWVIKIVEATREYRSKVFADRNRAKQFRDVMLSSYFAAKPGKMGGKP